MPRRTFPQPTHTLAEMIQDRSKIGSYWSHAYDILTPQKCVIIENVDKFFEQMKRTSQKLNEFSEARSKAQKDLVALLKSPAWFRAKTILQHAKHPYITLAGVTYGKKRVPYAGSFLVKDQIMQIHNGAVYASYSPDDVNFLPGFINYLPPPKGEPDQYISVYGLWKQPCYSSIVRHEDFDQLVPRIIAHIDTLAKKVVDQKAA